MLVPFTVTPQQLVTEQKDNSSGVFLNSVFSGFFFSFITLTVFEVYECVWLKHVIHISRSYQKDFLKKGLLTFH